MFYIWITLSSIFVILALLILLVLHLLDERDRLTRETITQETPEEKAAMDEWSARQW